MILEILYASLFLLIALVLISKLQFFKDEFISTKFTVFLFLIKIFFFILFYIIYTYYYTERNLADMYKYFDDGNWLYKCFINSPKIFIEVITRNLVSNEAKFYDAKINHWFMSRDLAFENSHRFIILFNFLCRFISMGNIFVHGIIINFLAFTGLWALYKTISRFSHTHNSILLFPIFFIPSVLFWGSGLLKEPLILFFLGYSIYYYDQLLQTKSIKSMSLFVVCIIGLFLLKSYIALFLLIMFCLIFFYHINQDRNRILITALFTFSIGVIIFLLVKYGGRFNPIFIIEQKLLAFDHMLQTENNASIYYIYNDPLNSFYNWMKQLNSAIIVAIFRPFPWEIRSLFMGISFIENYLLIGIFISSLMMFIIHKTSINPKTINWIIFLLGFSIMLYTLSGLISMNFGALMRYKMPALLLISIIPFLLIPAHLIQKVQKIFK